MQDDLLPEERHVPPLTQFDPGIATYRTAEAIAVGLAFAKALLRSGKNASLQFAFRWTKLKGRELASWAHPQRYISPGRVATDDEVTALVDVPDDTPVAAIAPYVQSAVAPLLAAFRGFELAPSVIEDYVQKLLARDL